MHAVCCVLCAVFVCSAWRFFQFVVLAELDQEVGYVWPKDLLSLSFVKKRAYLTLFRLGPGTLSILWGYCTVLYSTNWYAAARLPR